MTDDEGGLTQLTTDLNVTRENAVTTFVGPLFISSDNDGGFALDLRTVVQDITFFTGYPGYDPERGDITRDDIPTAEVTYVITADSGGSPTTLTALVAPIDADSMTGVAVTSLTGTLANNADGEAFTIDIFVNGYYVGSDATVITVGASRW